MRSIGSGLGSDHARYFVPTQLANCVLWLKADRGVTSASNLVSNWADQSGSSNDYAQATGANKPTLASTGGPNGGPALSFDGAASFLSRTSAPLGNNSLTLFVVLQATSFNAGHAVMSMGNSGGSAGWDLTIDIAGSSRRELTLSGLGFLTDDSATTNWEAWVVTRGASSTNWGLRVNGATTALNGGSNPNAQEAASMIGARVLGGPNNFLPGSIDEVIGFSRLLTATEIAQVEAYVRARTLIW